MKSALISKIHFGIELQNKNFFDSVLMNLQCFFLSCYCHKFMQIYMSFVPFKMTMKHIQIFLRVSDSTVWSGIKFYFCAA